MKRQLRLWLCVMAWASLAGADVIMFSDGAFDEGYVRCTGAFITVIGRDGKSEYSVSTALVAQIEYDRWYSELDAQARASTKGGPITTVNTQNYLMATTSEAVQRQLHKQRSALTWMSTFMKKDGPCPSARSTVQALSTLVIFLGFIVCGLITFIASIFLIIDAFKHSVLWGLLCLLCGVALFIYLFAEYEGRRGRMYFFLTAPLWWLFLVIGVQQLTRLFT